MSKCNRKDKDTRWNKKFMSLTLSSMLSRELTLTTWCEDSFKLETMSHFDDGWAVRCLILCRQGRNHYFVSLFSPPTAAQISKMIVNKFFLYISDKCHCFIIKIFCTFGIMHLLNAFNWIIFAEITLFAVTTTTRILVFQLKIFHQIEQ